MKDPALSASDKVGLKALLELKTSDERVRYTQKEHIKVFLRRYEEQDWQDARNHWEAMIKTPEFLGAVLGIHVAVIIDEFQEL